MNFSDPFNRVAAREQQDYDTLQRHLSEAGIDSEDKAVRMLAQSRLRMIKLILLAGLVCLAIAALLPQWAGVVLVSGALLELWLITVTLRGQRLFTRFIKEQFKQQRMP